MRMEKLRFGIIGAGGIAHGHATRLAGSGEADIVAVAEPNPASVQVFRERTGLAPRVYHSHNDMLRGEQLDCVLIGSPHTLHFTHSRDCLQMGLHVLCEKPMVCRASDAHALQEIIARSNRVFMISYQRHTEPKYIWMHEQVTSGRLGRLSYIAATSCQEWLWLTRGSWRQDPDLSGGGQLNDTGSHFVDLMIWLAGRIDQVQALQDFAGTRVDINSAVAVRFASGALATFSVIGDAHCWWEDWTVSCEKGTIFYRNGRLFLATLGQGVREVPDSELPPAPADVDRAFLDAVRGRSPVLVPASIGLGVIEFTEAAWRSAREGGRPVKVAEL
jgi:predicted dehydrogenase